jgi:hypothetical protein
VYIGGSDESSFVLEATWASGHHNAWLGWSVGAADLNLDGYTDVVLGAPGIDNGQTDEGQVWAFLAPFDAGLIFANDGNVAYAQHGSSIATGDVSGDGFPDILAGAPGTLGEPSSTGATYLWPGNGIWLPAVPSIPEGAPRRFRMFTEDLSQAVALQGAVMENQVRIGGILRSPLGRDALSLEVEIKPTGTPFDGAGTVMSSFSDTGAPTGEGSTTFEDVLLTSLSEGEHHWRARLVGKRPEWRRSPWFTPVRNARTQTDLRHRPEVVSVESSDGRAGGSLMALPNVFQRSTVLRFELGAKERVTLRIFDAQGREVDRPFAGVLGSGLHEIEWRPGEEQPELAGGIYFARLETETWQRGAKLVWVR